jgi:hypothetical protein
MLALVQLCSFWVLILEQENIQEAIRLHESGSECTKR